MATKQLTALKDFKYGTRMMRAGDPVEMTAPDARLFLALGAVAPRAAAQAMPRAQQAAESAPAAETEKPKPSRRRKAARKAKV